MKKGSTCAILTFVFLFFILMIISTTMTASGVDAWFMLDQASNAISTCIPEYVANQNMGLQQAVDQLPAYTEFLKRFMVSAPDYVKTIGTMAAWSIAPMVLGWIAFIRREF